ncbi:multiple monosaccharide ABC transporter substrate-binding protein [Caldibacillus debilis]|uniref:multiple monosaccharide ABC transporter substrate-binding protein n=1 Tax=Caldibacillus debilis TaxID=301148 RepID=UPI002FDA6AF5
MKKKLFLMVIAVLLFALTGCSSAGGGKTSGKESKGFVGIAMPTKSAERWIQDGGNMKKILEEKGYKVDLQYAEDVVENQISQIENMITKGVDVLVIASIDGKSLTNVLEGAKAQNIPVISYDRLIMDTDHVNYYVTFDNYKVGQLQGKYIEEKLGLKEGKGPYNIELFAGSPDDNNAYFFFDGAMSILKPYMDKGQLIVQSGQTKFEQVATLRWDGSLAQSRMDNILSAHYTDKRLDAVLSPYDPISLGVISSLKGVGYGTKDKPLPLITGQDADLASIKSIVAGEQTQTIFKDTRKLAEKAVEMIEALLSGKEPEVNDTKSYDNGVKVVPAYLLEPVSVDVTNYKEVLIDSGYYTEEQIKN